MDINKVVLVAGGDLRQVYLAQHLADFFTVYAVGFDKNVVASDKILLLDGLVSFKKRIDYLILPIPVSNDGVMLNTPFFGSGISIESLVSLVKDGGIVFGGKFSAMAKAIFDSKGIETIDYLKREELAVLNAVPTAEGALQIAMEELPTTIFGQNILITGYGRISKVLAKLLIGFGAKVSIAARKYSDIAWAGIFECDGVHISKIDEKINRYDIIFNTVPALLFDEKRLSYLKKSCLLIDLASKPGGVDFDAASSLGVKVIWALSLPGKVAPVTSGEIIGHTIINILEERGDDNV
ncbi:MAG: dipicolinate synthase subunit DpsA [Oscillospiraceae bacterium]